MRLLNKNQILLSRNGALCNQLHKQLIQKTETKSLHQTNSSQKKKEKENIGGKVQKKEVDTQELYRQPPALGKGLSK